KALRRECQGKGGRPPLRAALLANFRPNATGFLISLLFPWGSAPGWRRALPVRESRRLWYVRDPCPGPPGHEQSLPGRRRVAADLCVSLHRSWARKECPTQCQSLVQPKKISYECAPPFIGTRIRLVDRNKDANPCLRFCLSLRQKPRQQRLSHR